MKKSDRKLLLNWYEQSMNYRIIKVIETNIFNE